MHITNCIYLLLNSRFFSIFSTTFLLVMLSFSRFPTLKQFLFSIIYFTICALTIEFIPVSYYIQSIIVIFFIICFLFFSRRKQTIRFESYLFSVSSLFFVFSVLYAFQGFCTIKHIQLNSYFFIVSILKITLPVLLNFSIYPPKNVYIEKQSNIFTCIIIFIISDFTFLSTCYFTDTSYSFKFLLSISFIFICTIISFLASHNHFQDLRIKEYNAKMQLLSITHEQMFLTQNQIEKYMNFKHDLIHKLSDLNTEFSNHDSISFQNSIDKIISELDNDPIHFYSTNTLINTILNYKTERYPFITIQSEIHIQSTLNSEIISDLCIIISRLIDYCSSEIDCGQSSAVINLKCIQSKTQIALSFAFKSLNIDNLKSNNSFELLNYIVKKNYGTIQQSLQENNTILILLNQKNASI